ncbi:TonB-dependent siderophore receptor [Ralstonia wenshanensis]|uniref:TonB-dependent siderophore receptor n=1 Tax=Ralstonia wenshanensis TaxID=2842456 RepID=UPI0021B3AB64|nr:TonB-dependent receptor [Ralstonia wenshanensis]MCT7304973.1 TonB-dependent receptor [Ralstonia wenshanensis]
MSFPSGLAKDLFAGPVRGTMSAQQAAEQALKNSGLQLTTLTDNTLTIVGAPEAPRDIGTLPPAEVRARTGSDFAAFTTGFATHIETPITSVPHAVSTLTRNLLASQNAPSIGDALALAGVSSMSLDPTAAPRYATRGFMTGQITVDGQPDKMASLRPVEAVEDVSVIKGAHADIGGTPTAVGAINANLRAPAVMPQRTVTVEIGSHAERKAVVDLAGPIGSTDLSYRTVALQDTTANSDSGYAGRRKSYGLAALGWRDAATEVTVGLESATSRQPMPPATFALNGAPVRLALQSPLGNADDNVQSRASRGYYKVSRTLSDDWSLHSRGTYEALSQQSVLWHLAPVINNTAPSLTFNLGDRSDNTAWAISNELTGKFAHGLFEHAFTLGWDEFHERQDMAFASTPALMPQNPFAPVALPPATFVPGLQVSQSVRQSVFRVRDQIAIGERWELSGALYVNDYVAKLPRAQLQGTAWTPSLGLLYKLTPHTAWFADYSRGFRLNTSYFDPYQALLPERSRQLETGLRWADANRGLTTQAALYRIDAHNVRLVDVAPAGYDTQIAQQSSEGLEVSMQGAVTKGLDTSLWVALSRVSGTLTTGYLPQAPFLSGAVWTTYTMQAGPLKGAGAGIGITGQRGAPCYGDTPFRMPGFVRIDTSLFWHQKSWSVDLFARNLFNIRAYGNAQSGNFIPVQPGRTLTLRVTHNF